MPLDACGKYRAVPFYGFNDPVGGCGGDPKSFSQIFDTLMVKTIYSTGFSQDII